MSDIAMQRFPNLAVGDVAGESNTIQPCKVVNIYSLCSAMQKKHCLRSAMGKIYAGPRQLYPARAI
ncbi:MAG TPA: hypothetical protein VFV38_12115 [Ktedonobacteraceae bacterium]|nr:hypothetical protein [Ktedonobacteraceae bacterium]